MTVKELFEKYYAPREVKIKTFINRKAVKQYFHAYRKQINGDGLEIINQSVRQLLDKIIKEHKERRIKL